MIGRLKKLAAAQVSRQQLATNDAVLMGEQEISSLPLVPAKIERELTGARPYAQAFTAALTRRVR